MIPERQKINAKLQSGEGAKIELKRNPHRRLNMLIGLLLYFGFWLACCGGCSFLLTNFLSGPDWPEDFCTVEDNLYELLAARGKQWADDLAEHSGEFTNSQMSVDIGKRRLWLYGEGDIGFYVRVVYAPRFALGKAGYFYARTGELPVLGPKDELTHLGGSVYCYILDDPG
ncbi:MAG: hypothetical protein K8J31_12230 [Anaerolineae bacterium]|nr:hypothetical protein [Anaerolineae bacterium]